MSLKTRFGNLGNVYDEDPSQTSILQLEIPVDHDDRASGGGRPFRRGTGDDRLHLAGGRPESLRVALERIRQEAEDAVRGGCETLILTDEEVGPERAAMPMILAVGAVHSHLVRQGLRCFSSITCARASAWTHTASRC